MWRMILIVLWLMPAVLVASEIYRWVDEDGNVHFSDQKHDGAEEVERRELQTMEPFRGSPAPEKRAESGPQYEQISITSPEQDEIFWYAEGAIGVNVSLSPQLRPGHRLVIALDGEPVGEGTSTSLEGLLRGTYQVHAEVLSGEEQLIASEPVTFHVRQPSRLIPRSAP